MNSRHLTKGHYLWPKPEGSWLRRQRHIVHAIRTVRGFHQFDVRVEDEAVHSEILDPNEHWLTFSQVRSNFNFNPPTTQVSI